jgi:hypothetical protein
VGVTEAEVEAELRPEKEEESLGMASPKDISDTHLLPFPHQACGRWKIQSLHGSNPEHVRPHSDALCHASPYLCIVFEGHPQLEATNTRNDRLVFAERCSAAILDGLPDKMGDQMFQPSLI